MSNKDVINAPGASPVASTSFFKNLMGRAEYYIKNQEALNGLITQAYNKATHEKGNRTVMEMFEKLRLLFRMLKAHFLNDYQGINNGKILIGIAVILYFVLPVDLLPDFIPVAGFLDDASLLAWFIKNSVDEIKKFQQWESEGEPEIFPLY
jgi:uncharacterized membrane protein YkvA (DUF1232 family)